jgi:hypothetical protein
MGTTGYRATLRREASPPRVGAASPQRDSQGSCQSAEQGDYKHLIYFYY